MRKNFKLLEGASVALTDEEGQPDKHLLQWRSEGTGLYSTNGAVLGIFKRSSPELRQPDLFIFGVPGDFKGYEVGYSNQAPKDRFTWIILKSHSKNRHGVVRLRSTNPRDTPSINFHYFGTSPDGGDRASGAEADLESIAHGVDFVREIADTAKGVVKREIHPGRNVEVKDWIRSEAWGHHACGTCRMGPDGDEEAVLDSRFRVRKVQGLRVVDASIFPDIPGYFIVSNIYMASEKAADVILEDARNAGTRNPHYPDELRAKEAEAIRVRRNVLVGCGGELETHAHEVRSRSKSVQKIKDRQVRL